METLDSLFPRPTSTGGDIARVSTICPYRGTGCGIRLLAKGGRLVGMEPDFGNPVSEGSLCVKGQFASWEFVNSKDRLTHPLVRRNGSFEAVTWEEAYSIVGSRLAEIRDTSGPDALALWSSARATNEANYLMQKLARAVIGTNNVDNCART
jgi:predicted molibdopterin-dependent oxidoreductase YjgC